MSIRQWRASERPREKLLRNGAASLSDAELLAIFVQSGVAGQSAIDVARKALDAHGGLLELVLLDQQRFCRIRGLGSSRYALVQAAVELNRRLLFSRVREREVLNSPEVVRDYLALHLAGLEHEVFAALFLDNRHRLIEYRELFQGTIDSAAVYPREVVKHCLSRNAAA
ncbi:MAG: hypothetical protein CSA54_01920, partial [Gammaproteobacteria bacterium]